MHRLDLTRFLFAMLSVIFCGVAMPDDRTSKQSAILDRTIEIASRDDTFKAIAYLERQGSPTEVAEHYSRLLRKSYFDKRDVSLMVMFGRAGISYSLSQARLAQATDLNTANKLKSQAKTIAYNLGANTWPGWNDEGVTIDKSDIRAGLDASRLNLRLAVELKRSEEVLANAYWLLGAQLLAAGQLKTAEESFLNAAKKFRTATKTESALMAEGYVALARKLLDASDVAERQFESSVDALTEHGSEDAKFFAGQLRTAARVFSQ